MAEAGTIRVAALSDIHYGKHSRHHMKELFERVSASADVLLLCGDLTDYGTREEAEILGTDLREHVRIPMLGVLGNHDFESGTPEIVTEIMEESGVKVLDGDCAVIHDIGFAGVSGFGGGFGRFMLNAWGEPLIKQFVQASVDEELKLEQALSKLQTDHRVVLMHYAPICQTVASEPKEIWPFLGSSRLEDPLNRFTPLACFHGHSHKGVPEGKTASGVPVYNVCIHVLSHHYPDQPPFRLLEIDTSVPVNTEQAEA